MSAERRIFISYDDGRTVRQRVLEDHSRCDGRGHQDHDEVFYALDGDKTVVPVLQQRCVIPLRLRHLHYTDFTADYSAGFDDLRRSLAPFAPAAGRIAQPPRLGAWEAEARSLARNGRKIEAIKFVRENTGMGLREAKDLVGSW